MPGSRGDGRLTHDLDPHDRSPQDACGVFGVWAPGEDVAKLTYYGLYALQHRGQESAGIAVSNGRQILVYKDMGLVSQVFDESTLASLKGHLAVGHARYSTTGASTWHNAQPTFRPTESGAIALAHNGNLTNTRDLAARVDALPPGQDESEVSMRNVPASTNDTSLVTALLAHHPDRSLEENAVELLPTIRGRSPSSGWTRPRCTPPGTPKASGRSSWAGSSAGGWWPPRRLPSTSWVPRSSGRSSPAR